MHTPKDFPSCRRENPADKNSRMHAKNKFMQGGNVPEKVHSQMVRAGGKNYFFDVKKASNGNHYLTIAESYQKKDGEKVINRIMLFRDHFADFSKALAEVENHL